MMAHAVEFWWLWALLVTSIFVVLLKQKTIKKWFK
jgi:hypothetical protein